MKAFKKYPFSFVSLYITQGYRMSQEPIHSISWLGGKHLIQRCFSVFGPNSGLEIGHACLGVDCLLTKVMKWPHWKFISKPSVWTAPDKPIHYPYQFKGFHFLFKHLFTRYRILCRFWGYKEDENWAQRTYCLVAKSLNFILAELVKNVLTSLQGCPLKHTF